MKSVVILRCWSKKTLRESEGDEQSDERVTKKVVTWSGNEEPPNTFLQFGSRINNSNLPLLASFQTIFFR